MRVAACLLFVIPLVACQEFYPKSSGVINLDSSNFDSSVNKGNAVWLVEFYAPWCGHCKSLKPEWVAAAKALSGLVKVAAVDANEERNRGLAGRFQIQGFPTIKMIVPGESAAVDYQGGRDYKSIATWAKAQIPSSGITKVTEKTEHKFITAADDNDTERRVLLFTDKKASSALFKALSLKYKGFLKCGEVHSSEKRLVGKYEVKAFPSLLVVGPSTAPVTYEGPSTARAISRFLSKFVEGFEDDDGDSPVPEIVDQSCLEQYCMGGKSLCLLLAMSNKDKGDHYLESLKSVEQARSDSLFNFVWIDREKNKEWLQKNFGVDPSSNLPTAIVLSAPKNRFAKYGGVVNQSNLAAFLNDILTGKTSTFAVNDNKLTSLPQGSKHCKNQNQNQNQNQSDNKSPPPRQEQRKKPESDPLNGDNIKLTSKNFEETVLKSSQPWMVEFMAPWCGHCKQLQPIWDEASKQSKNMVRFGYVDATADQALAQQFGIQGFPTIKMFPPGMKTMQMARDYSGQRSVSALLNSGFGLLHSNFVSRVDHNVFSQWYSNEPTKAKVVLFSDKKDIPKLYQALSIGLSEHLLFGIVSSEDAVLMKELQVPRVPFILVIDSPELQQKQAAEAAEKGVDRPAGMTARPYMQALSFKPLHAFLLQSASTQPSFSGPEGSMETVSTSEPTVHHAKSQNDLEKMCLKRLGICVLSFFSPENINEARFQDMLMNLAKKYNGRPVHIVKADRLAQSKFFDSLGLSYDMTVASVAISGSKKRYATFVGVFDEEHIVEFVDAVTSGRLGTAPLPASLPKFADESKKDEL